MTRRMLMNAGDPEETRIAIVDNDKLEEFYIEGVEGGLHVGDIVKARVLNLEPGIQAAFLDGGGARNIFLHVSEIMPHLYAEQEADKEGKEKTSRRSARRLSITKLLHKGQELAVQITKEGVGSKGPGATTYLSLPGRYLVMIPGVKRRGISRKIEDPDQRERLKTLLDELKLPEDTGLIVRTASRALTKRELRRDLNYLLRLWHTIQKRIKKASAPATLYRESDLAIRAVRDLFTSDIDEIIIDSEPVYRNVKDFLQIVMPRYARRAKLYDEKTIPLFHRFKLEDEIDKIYKREVKLPKGGSVVIERTEALVAVDVNSGSFRGEKDPELAALKIDMMAAEEIARQIRLRDLGGLIICDFIDLEKEAHRRQVERVLAEQLKKDRARTKMLRMSHFGVIQITRQRLRSAVEAISYQNCPWCRGIGMVKSPASMAVSVLRQIKAQLAKSDVTELEVRVNPKVAEYLQNRKRADLNELEQRIGKTIAIQGADNLRIDNVEMRAHNIKVG